MHLTQIVRLGPTVGGIGQVALQYHRLAAALQQSPRPVSLSTIVDSPVEVYQSHYANIEATYCPGITSNLSNLNPWSLAELARILRGSDALLLHTGTNRLAIRLLGLTSQSYRVPMIGIAHNDSRISKATKYDGMICLTPCQAERIHARHGDFPTQTVPHPLSAEDFPDSAFDAKVHALDPRRANIGIACNLTKIKNVGRALGEFAHLLRHAEQPEIWKLHIAGEGPESQALRELAREHGIDQHVVFHGWIDASQRARFFADTDVLWHTSTVETFGLTMVEAAYYGCHAQVMRTAGASFISQPNGIPELELLEQNAPTGQLASLAIDCMRNFESRPRKLVAARRNAINSFSPAAIAPRWREAIETLVGHKGRSKAA